MPTLEDLLAIKVAVWAGEVSPDGKIVDSRSAMEMKPEVLAVTAEFLATVTSVFTTLASAHKELTSMSWLPPRGWLYAGGDWIVASSGGKAVFVRASETSLDDIMGRLSPSEPSPPA